jgi:hypothetical protein
VLKERNIGESSISTREEGKGHSKLDYLHVEVNKGTSNNPVITKLVLPYSNKAELVEFLRNPNWKEDLVFVETNAFE